MEKLLLEKKKSEVLYICLHLTQTKTHATSVTVEPPREWTWTAPIFETSKSIKPSDNNLGLNVISYTHSKNF